MLDNPHYEKPVDPTLAPTATPKPTKKPSSENAGQTATQATNTPAAAQSQDAQSTATKNPYHGLGSSLIYVYDEPTTTVMPTQAPTPEPVIQTEYITIGPGMPYQADGNSHTLDVLYSAATNKQFISKQLDKQMEKKQIKKSGGTFAKGLLTGHQPEDGYGGMFVSAAKMMQGTAGMLFHAVKSIGGSKSKMQEEEAWYDAVYAVICEANQ